MTGVVVGGPVVGDVVVIRSVVSFRSIHSLPGPRGRGDADAEEVRDDKDMPARER